MPLKEMRYNDEENAVELLKKMRSSGRNSEKNAVVVEIRSERL